MSTEDEQEDAKGAAPPPKDDPGDDAGDDPLAAAILALLAERSAGRSVTPEEVARSFAAGRAKPSDPP